jgi:hypothetical protein
VKFSTHLGVFEEPGRIGTAFLRPEETPRVGEDAEIDDDLVSVGSVDGAEDGEASPTIEGDAVTVPDTVCKEDWSESLTLDTSDWACTSLPVTIELGSAVILDTMNR